MMPTFRCIIDAEEAVAFVKGDKVIPPGMHSRGKTLSMFPHDDGHDLPNAAVVFHTPERYSSAMWTAMAPSATAVTTCRRSFVRTSPTAYTPGMLVSVVSPAAM